MTKKLRRIVLHVGPDKTGSTAIQNAMFKGRNILLANGIIYSSGDYLNDRLLRDHFLESSRLAEAYSNNNQALRRSQLLSTKYIERLEAEIANQQAHELVLSFEGLVHLNESELIALRDFLMNYTDYVNVVIYIRDPVSYATSAMSQRVESGRRAVDDIVPPYMRYKDFLPKLGQVFGKNQLKLRLYSRALFPEGDVVRDFLDLFELDQNQKVLIATNSKFIENSSLSYQGLLLGDRIVELLGANAPKAQDFKKLFVPELHKLRGRKIKLSLIQFILLRIRTYKHINYVHKVFGFKVEMKNYNFRDQYFISKNRKREIDDLAKELISKMLPDFSDLSSRSD